MVGVEPATLTFLINCSTIFTITFPFVDNKFYIKPKPCPETHNFKMMGGQMGTLDLWTPSLPLYHLSHTNHVQWRNC